MYMKSTEGMSLYAEMELKADLRHLRYYPHTAYDKQTEGRMLPSALYPGYTSYRTAPLH